MLFQCQKYKRSGSTLELKAADVSLKTSGMSECIVCAQEKYERSDHRNVESRYRQDGEEHGKHKT